MDPTPFKALACNAIDKATPDLKAISKEIFDHPELGFQEVHAHKCLTDLLEQYGFSVERSYKLDTAFRATYGSTETGGPNIAVLCEYDALPGLGHACGHNLIAEVGVAAGIGAKAALETAGKVMGKLTVLGTPAEEGGGGKVALINAGAFTDVDAAMMAHPAHFNLPKPKTLSMTNVKVTYCGKESHAAIFPWEGVSALDAAVLCYQSLACVKQQMKPSWKFHGIISNGGTKANIIPKEASLEYFMWTPTDPEMNCLKQKFETCVEGAGKATGCSSECVFTEKPYTSLLNNNVMVSLYVDNASSYGVQWVTDPEVLNRLIGSTDMGNVSKLIPAIHPTFFVGNAGVHTADFVNVAGSPDAQNHALTTGKALAMTALDMFLQPELMLKVKENFTCGSREQQNLSGQ